MSHASHSSPPPIDPTTGEAALAKIRARLASLPAESLSSPNFDVQAAVVAALALARFTREPRVYERFAELPRSAFDLACLEDLELGAAALWFAQTESLDAGVLASGARVSIDVAHRGAELRARMLRLLEYHLEDDPSVGPELADIRSGAGYLDLATDLTRLAKLYDLHKGRVEKDPKHYRVEDAAAARATARRILEELGEHGGGEDWMDLRKRTWTFVTAAADEIRAAGAFLFRQEPEVARFAPLRTLAGVANPGRPRKKGPEPAEEGPANPPSGAA